MKAKSSIFFMILKNTQIPYQTNLRVPRILHCDIEYIQPLLRKDWLCLVMCIRSNFQNIYRLDIKYEKCMFIDCVRRYNIVKGY